MEESPAGFVEGCLREQLLKAIEASGAVSPERARELAASGKLTVSRTPDPSLGHHGVALHAILKGIERSKWDEIARELLSAMRSIGAFEKCYVVEAKFVNGYLNFTIDYARLSRNVLEEVLGGSVRRRLASVGGGRKVIVEHTSANPVHPLHIGSGRNSVLGDTFARLLAGLGYAVSRRFYVNDMGRQVAVLVYGARALKRRGVQRPSWVKPDHWYGAIYALTNLVAERLRLASSAREAEAKAWESIEGIARELSSSSSREALEALAATEAILGKRGTIFDWRSLANYVKRVDVLAARSEDVGKAWRRPREQVTSYVHLLARMAAVARSEARLAALFPEAHAAISSELRDFEQFEREVRELMKRREAGDPEVENEFMEAVSAVLEGFRKTLDSYGISFDGFDWESDRKILGLGREVVVALEGTKYARREGGALLVDLDAAAREHTFVKELFGSDAPGKFVVQRSDGTTLYVTRDIAYAIYKFRELGAELVYNVIAVEQAREQRQVMASLYLLGHEREARSIVHFAYEMVHMPGARMSGRMGRYYTMDELLEDLRTVVAAKILAETGRRPEPEAAAALARANARALLLGIDPSKVLVVDRRKLGELSAGADILYSYVRAQGILRKAFGVEPIDNLERLAEGALGAAGHPTNLSEEERRLVELLATFEQVVLSAYRDLRPDKLLDYALELANAFNRFYEYRSVLGERDEALRSFRLALTVAFLQVMDFLVYVLGFDRLRRL
ncbi:MAG: arginine--tRNA ligase [Desulfurococcaceae archaeon]